MGVILKTLFLRDLRDNWVFPRLAYVTAGQAINRNARRVRLLLIALPRDRVLQLLSTLRDERDLAEMLLAALAMLATFLRAMALVIIAIGSLCLALAHL
jgi:hypothetical protein